MGHVVLISTSYGWSKLYDRECVIFDMSAWLFAALVQFENTHSIDHAGAHCDDFLAKCGYNVNSNCKTGEVHKFNAKLRSWNQNMFDVRQSVSMSKLGSSGHKVFDHRLTPPGCSKVIRNRIKSGRSNSHPVLNK